MGERKYPERKWRRLSKIEKEEILEWIIRGVAAEQIAKRFDCSLSQIAGLKATLTIKGWKLKTQKIPSEDNLDNRNNERAQRAIKTYLTNRKKCETYLESIFPKDKFIILSKGWPDYAIVEIATNNLAPIECKRNHGDHLKKEQELIFKCLTEGKVLNPAIFYIDDLGKDK